MMTKRFVIQRLVFPGVALLLVMFPTLTTHARSFTFDKDGIRWNVTVKMCRNGFSVYTLGGTTPGATTALNVEQVNKILLVANQEKFQETVPVTFASSDGSNLVASAANPQIPVVGTGFFYFQVDQPVNEPIQTVITGDANGAPFPVPGGTGTDYVADCQIPAPVPPTYDLSGVYDPLAYTRDFGKDGRAYPDAVEHVAVYCINTGPYAGTIVVNGIDASTNAYRLGEFKLNDLTRVTPRGVSKLAADGHGFIMLQYSRTGFHLEWTGGPWNPKEIKLFTCDFNKARFNKTDSQLKYPDAFGNDGRVAPDPADKMSVYCPTSGASAGSIVVMGIDKTSQGFPLAIFKYAEVVKVSPNPLTVETTQYGKVMLRVDNDDNFYLEWINGPWSAYEKKAFRCRF